VSSHLLEANPRLHLHAGLCTHTCSKEKSLLIEWLSDEWQEEETY
jgi:hypothetical protein